MPVRHSYSLLFMLLLITAGARAQDPDYNATLAKAIQHRNNQLISHTILWGYDKGAGADRFTFDQDTGTMTLINNMTIIQYDIQIIGTYDFKDSSFLWSTDNSSIHKQLTKAATGLLNTAAKKQWPIPVGKAIKCRFRQAKELQALAMYLDHANGMAHVTTNGNRTAVLYLFYNVQINDRMNKLFKNTVTTKTHYTLIDDTATINYARQYVHAYNDNEARYEALKWKNNSQINYSDSLLKYELLIMKKYWDTTAISFRRQDPRGISIRAYKAIKNWHVITVGDDTRYVVCEESLVYGTKTYTLEILTVNGKPKINNLYTNNFYY